MKETKSITIDKKVSDKIEEQYKKEGRGSYSNMLEWMAKKYLESLKK